MFEAEKKEVKREVSLKVMKENGGLLGKQYYDNPPTYFFPRNKEYLLTTTDDDQYKGSVHKPQSQLFAVIYLI